jgi:hypothetical protein
MGRRRHLRKLRKFVAHGYAIPHRHPHAAYNYRQCTTCKLLHKKVGLGHDRTHDLREAPCLDCERIHLGIVKPELWRLELPPRSAPKKRQVNRVVAFPHQISPIKQPQSVVIKGNKREASVSLGNTECWACGINVPDQEIRSHLEGHLEHKDEPPDVRHNARIQLDWALYELRVRILSGQGTNVLKPNTEETLGVELEPTPSRPPWEWPPSKKFRSRPQHIEAVPSAYTKATQFSPSPKEASPPKYRVHPPRIETGPETLVMLSETPAQVWDFPESPLSRHQKEALVVWLEAKGMPWKRTAEEIPESVLREVTGGATPDGQLETEIKHFLNHAIMSYREALRHESEW